MSDQFFARAYKRTLELEGGYSNRQADKGGPTLNGISLRFLQGLPLIDADINGDGHVTEADLHAMKPNDRIHLYKKYFWDYYRLKEIEHEILAAKLYDTLVNMRSVLAVKIVQRALRACQVQVLEDGVLGSKSIAAINGIRDPRNMLPAMRSEQWGVYQLIVAKDPSQEENANGWKNRAYS